MNGTVAFFVALLITSFSSVNSRISDGVGSTKNLMTDSEDSANVKFMAFDPDPWGDNFHDNLRYKKNLNSFEINRLRPEQSKRYKRQQWMKQ